MYTIDERDSVIEIAGFPQSDTGASLPVVVATEHESFLIFHLQFGSGGSPLAVVSFEQCLAHMSGAPNDEILQGHPLWDRGLRHYGGYEVLNSSWLRGLIRMNSVHPQHSPALFRSCRHFIFSFHDSTFECIANGYTIEIRQSSIRQVMSEISSGIGLH